MKVVRLYTMAEGELACTDVMNLLKAEPASGQARGVMSNLAAPSPDIPAPSKQLAMLVSTDKAKDVLGLQLSYEQVKCLSNNGVEKFIKRKGQHTWA